jgi:hypothetical protein
MRPTGFIGRRQKHKKTINYIGTSPKAFNRVGIIKNKKWRPATISKTGRNRKAI